MLSSLDLSGQEQLRKLYDNLRQQPEMSTIRRLQLLESGLAAKQIQHSLAHSQNEALQTDFQTAYAQALRDFSIELIDLSRYLFLSLTELDNPETNAANRPVSHTRIISAFEALSAIIINEILSKESITERTIILERWIAVMQHCFEAGDFHTTKVINTALNAVPVQRLKSTLAGLSKNARDILNTITEAVERPAAMYATMTKRKKITDIPYYIEYKNMFGGLKELGKEKSKPQADKLLAELNAAHQHLATFNHIGSDANLTFVKSQIVHGSRLDQAAALQLATRFEPKEPITLPSDIFTPSRLASLIIPTLLPSVQTEREAVAQTTQRKNAAAASQLIATYEKKAQASQETINTLLTDLKAYRARLAGDDKINSHRRKTIDFIIEQSDHFSESTANRKTLLKFLEEAGNDSLLKERHVGIGTIKIIKGDEPTILKFVRQLFDAFEAQHRYLEKLTELRSQQIPATSAEETTDSPHGSSISTVSSSSASFLKRSDKRKSVRITTTPIVDSREGSAISRNSDHSSARSNPITAMSFLSETLHPSSSQEQLSSTRSADDMSGDDSAKNVAPDAAPRSLPVMERSTSVRDVHGKGLEAHSKVAISIKQKSTDATHPDLSRVQSQRALNSTLTPAATHANAGEAAVDESNKNSKAKRVSLGEGLRRSFKSLMFSEVKKPDGAAGSPRQTSPKP